MLKKIAFILGIITFIFLIEGCMNSNLTQNNYILKGDWVNLNDNTSINKQISFSETDFTDENGQIIPFRVDSENKLFIKPEDQDEREISFSIDGDNLTLDGITFVRLNSPTYNQILLDYQNKLQHEAEVKAWNAQVEPLKSQLLNAYQDANTRMNDGLVEFITGYTWTGDYKNGDSYHFSFYGGDASLYKRVRNGNKWQSFDGTFIIPFETYKLSDYVTRGAINNEFNIPLNDQGALGRVQTEINRLNNLTFSDFVKNSTLMLTPTWQTDPISDATNISLSRQSGDFNITNIQVNNLNPDTGQMLVTLTPGGNSFLMSRGY